MIVERARPAVVLWMICLWAAPAVDAGIIVFDNYAPDFGSSSVAIYPVNFDSGTGIVDRDVANAFAPTDSGILTDIWVTISLVTGKNEVDVWLAEDDGGKPGAVLESWHFSGEMDSFDPVGFPKTPLHGLGDGTTFLTAGTQYWLVASAPLLPTETIAGWHLNGVGDVGPVAFQDDGAPWGVSERTRGAFRVAVPEPATIALCLAGIALALRRTIGHKE